MTQPAAVTSLAEARARRDANKPRGILAQLADHIERHGLPDA